MATTKDLSRQLAAALKRISSLADEIHMLKTELRTFKSDVAKDVNALNDKVGS